MREIASFDQKTNQARVLMKRFPNGTILGIAVQFLGGADIIPDDAMLMRMKACHHRSERRATKRRDDIALLKKQALRREGIEMWRLHDFVPHEAVVLPPLIVGENEDDVGSFCLCEDRQNQTDKNGGETLQN